MLSLGISLQVYILEYGRVDSEVECRRCRVFGRGKMGEIDGSVMLDNCGLRHGIARGTLHYLSI